MDIEADSPTRAYLGRPQGRSFNTTHALVVVDLPNDERHPRYAVGHAARMVTTPQGPVEYVYRSMTDLDVGDGAVAGILAWYSLIHLPPPDLDGVLAAFRRLLAPGALFHATPRPTTLMRVNCATTQDERFWNALVRARKDL